jgi:hypothetical protein
MNQSNTHEFPFVASDFGLLKLIEHTRRRPMWREELQLSFPSWMSLLPLMCDLQKCVDQAVKKQPHFSAVESASIIELQIGPSSPAPSL